MMKFVPFIIMVISASVNAFMLSGISAAALVFCFLSAIQTAVLNAKSL